MSFIVSGVTLPSPDFGDTESLVLKMHTHRNMTGDQFTFVHKPVGPLGEILRKLRYIFSNVTQQKYVALIAAISGNSDVFIITDHESVAWTVNILSTQTSFTVEGRKISEVDFTNQNCLTYPLASNADLGTITLEFEGYENV